MFTVENGCCFPRTFSISYVNFYKLYRYIYTYILMVITMICNIIMTTVIADSRKLSHTLSDSVQLLVYRIPSVSHPQRDPIKNLVSFGDNYT